MRKIVMMVSLVLTVLLMGCNNYVGINDHMTVIEGKVVEVRSDNVLLLEIVREHGGYEKGDKVLVHYEECGLIDLKDPEAQSTAYTTLVNDIIGAQFWPEKVVKKEGYNYIETRKLEKFINN